MAIKKSGRPKLVAPVKGRFPFYLDLAIMERFKQAIKKGQRNKFVNAAIDEKLKRESVSKPER